MMRCLIAPEKPSELHVALDLALNFSVGALELRAGLGTVDLARGLRLGRCLGLRRALGARRGGGGIGSLLTSWHLYALIALAGTGTVVQQYSFHAGPLTHSLPAMTIAEPILAFGMSYWVLGEKFSVSSAAGWAVMATALAVMILATIVLARVPVGPRPAQSAAK